MNDEEINKKIQQEKDKYFSLNLTEKQEDKIRQIVADRHKQLVKQIFDNENPRYKEVLAKMDKTEAAYLVWAHNKDCPDLKLGLLCNKYQISQGYFRELRQIKLKEWSMEHADYIDEMVMYEVLDAISPQSDDEYVKNCVNPIEYRNSIKSVVDASSP